MVINYTGISDSRSAYTAAALFEKKPGQGLIICATENKAKRIAGDLSVFSSAKIMILPDMDAAALRYEAKSTSELSGRISVLNSLISGEDVIVVAPVLGALKKLPPAEVYESGILKLEVGQEIKRDRLIARLTAMGYERCPAAESEGQLSVRGDIADIYPAGGEWPVRVDFFDDEVDSVRHYDPLTQRSIENLKDTIIYPSQLIIDSKKSFERAAAGIEKAYGRAVRHAAQTADKEKLSDQMQYLTDLIHEHTNLQYMECFISYFYEKPELLWDYMKNPSFIMIEDPSRIAETLDFYQKEETERIKSMIMSCAAVKEDFASSPDPEDMMIPAERLGTCVDVVFATPFAQQIKYADRLDELKNVTAHPAPVFAGHMDLLEKELKRYLGNGYEVRIACSSEEREINLLDFLRRSHIDSGVDFFIGNLTSGSDFADDKLLWLSESEIFPSVKHRSSSSRKPRKDRAIRAFTDINKGDYVVHENHGVGMFSGIEKLKVGGSERDYLRIQYAGEDVLYVPVEQMETIQKYVGSESIPPRLNKLSGQEWAVTKAKAKAAVKDMAEELLRMSAERSLNKGWKFGPDTPWQKEFEDAFPYVETNDQLRCTEEIKRDMESSKAMDRLLCGDVGYGKTEVAARAIFKCLAEGKQAAVLVPTTVLANQHFHTLKSRFANFPFKVEMLSRFRNPSQQDEIVRKLNRGEIDLIVGTHRILSSDVKFKDLGLLVIDEEQRFGVEHKEKIKNLKKNVDVLTLSATPIPRTLHMSLIGVREMSVIEEPPDDRYPVQTYVLEQDDRMITDAIRRELGRGGQVYVVYNRVRGIQTLARKIKELVPEAEIAVGHGQMNEHDLEDVMMDFSEGRTQILIATTIVESGLDIPNVNTIIIIDADRLGLSQLYQLRGRVGRSSRIAYAYLMYKKDKVLSELAESRLRAIREFTEFGSGFRVAMRDLELRGAGNLLGMQQSGHMVSVGYELYCKLVEEAVRELSGQAPEELPINSEVSIEFPVKAFLPETYITDEMTRLSMYKKIASVTCFDDRMEVTDELIDRFGDLPPEADRLIDVAMIRNQAAKCGVSRIVEQQSSLVFLFDEKNILTPEIYARLAGRFGRRLLIYGRTIPKISLNSGKIPYTEDALAFLECILETDQPQKYNNL